MAITNPLQIQHILFTKSHIYAIPGHSVPENVTRSDRGPTNTLNIEKIGDDEYSVTMNSSFNLEQDISEPYLIDVMCIGIFKVIDKNVTPDQINKALNITGHSVVYGAIRENVMFITSRCVYGAFMLGLSILQPPKQSDDTEEKS